MVVRIDNPQHLAPLADKLDQTPFQTIEISYQIGIRTGIIILSHDGVYRDELWEILDQRIQQYIKEKGI